ncbi:MAG TPA: hypothetical protein VHQ90_19730 [Thermoanaerobaculia bacterium]|nr:hypothetical protein [Thermoanaerobaculia bacterium]
MTFRDDIWRQRIWVWLPALIFLLANAMAFVVYRFGFSDRVRSLEQDLQQESRKLSEAQAERMRLSSLLIQAKRNQVRVHKLYAEDFSTRRRRLTEVTDEVKSLAARSGLAPRSLSYPEQVIEQYGLIKRSFVFTVEGTYLDLRKFLNLLELSSSFLTLEDANLSSGGARGKELRIDLTLSTLFAASQEVERAGGPVKSAGAARSDT